VARINTEGGSPAAASIKTQLFVSALGASSFTFALAALSQELPAWLDRHARMYEAFGGVSAIAVPDLLRSAIASADRYDAQINPSYRELADHYGTCIIPARVGKPRDKGKVEAAVLVAQRWILTVLRHRRFYHLEDLNRAIAELLAKLNDRVMRHVKQSRRQLYERLDRSALKALPAQPYEYAAWKQVGVNIDYHIDFNRRGNALVPRHGAHGETDPPGQAHHLARQKLKQIRLQRASRASPRLAPGAPRVNTVPLDRLGPECRRAR
jgi:hypothetical protein